MDTKTVEVEISNLDEFQVLISKTNADINVLRSDIEAINNFELRTK